MKNSLKVLSVAALALGLGFGISNTAVTNAAAGSSIAVVDVAQVINNNSQVKALKAKQEKKSEALKSWVETARADVEKQSTDAAKVSLTNKYNKELQSKVEAQRKELYDESTKIDAKIGAAIAKKAQADGYSLVLVKGAVLYGGADITEDIKKVTK
ncbi:MAG: OmpH family outer membrane protein [Candidatus Gastranaerophilales bacterium]|nr:OmpH family outer membrane protein [Candidatus Gastranaerophilales bacterium]